MPKQLILRSGDIGITKMTPLFFKLERFQFPSFMFFLFSPTPVELYKKRAVNFIFTALDKVKR
jgi:hypothetical protein